MRSTKFVALGAIVLTIVAVSGAAGAAGVGDIVVPQAVVPAAQAAAPAQPAASPACGGSADSGVVPCYANPPATPYPQPATGQVDPASAALPRGMMANFSDTMLGQVDTWFSGALNAAVIVGQWLYVRIAAISIVFAFISWFVAGESVMAIIRTLYWRVLEAVVWLALISWTWKSPIGPGWFPMIIGGLASIGAAIANQVAGKDIIPTGVPKKLDVLAGGDVAVLPGTILDLAASVFSVVGAYAWASFAGQDTGNTWIDKGKAIVAIVSGALTGTIFASGIIYLLTLLLGMTLYMALAMVAFRYFVTVIKVYVMGCLMFMQGLAGSRRLSVYAGGFLSGAIVLGAEFALVSILVGIFYSVVVGLIQFTGYWPVILSVASSAASLSPVPLIGMLAKGTQFGFSLGMLMLLNLVAAGWLILVWKTPEMVAHFFKGQVNVSTTEVIQALKNSPTLPGKVSGEAADSVNAVAQRGPVMATFDKMKQMAGIASIGGSEGDGSAKDVAQGAMKGAMVGGVQGAAVGAASAWFLGKRASARNESSDGGGTIRSGSARAGQNGAAREGSPAAPGDASDATRSRTVTTQNQYRSVGQDDDASSEASDALAQTRSRTVTDDVRVAQTIRDWNAYVAMKASGQDGGSGGGGQLHGGAGFGSGGGQSGSAFDNFRDEMATNTRVSKMLAQRFLYSANVGAARGHQPLPEPEPPIIQAAPLHLGER